MAGCSQGILPGIEGGIVIKPINFFLDYETACYITKEFENPEKMCHISAMLWHSPDITQLEKTEVFETLKSSLIKLKAEESPEKYLSFHVDNDNSIIDYYLDKAFFHFCKGEIEQYDHYVQRKIAIQSIFYTSMDILTARERTQELISKNIYEAKVKLFEIERDRRFPIASVKDAERDTQEWLKHDKKLQLANIVSNILLNFSSRKVCCLELGCHAGALLHLIENKIANQRSNIEFIGIEPDLKAIQVAEKLFPDLDIRIGNHEMLIQERNSLPDRISVLLLSNILLLNSPAVVDDIFSFARDNVDTIVIMDDIANFNGQYAVFRRKYILHPFGKLLFKYNFRRVELAYPDNPNEATTGIIVVKRDNLG